VGYYLLRYDLRDDYFTARTEHRPEHLAWVKQAVDEGALRLAGAHTDIADGSTLVWKVDDPARIEQFAENDPYVRAGIVTSWRIIPWTVVAGADFAD
jgi:uncharacterized protein